MVAFLLQQQKTQIDAMSGSILSSDQKKNYGLKDGANQQKEEDMILDVESRAEKGQNPDLGYLLVAFLHHFGNKYNLNSDTVVRVKLQAYVPPHTVATQQCKHNII